ncbi:minichromosome maintenance protein 9 [Angomonas deanei]|uniref:MCM OB domain/MCM P-loop domain/MCM AAA-lid domain containing protein, putative n=1 Tax=Angomonas deanei TaxID=59799 RepID=A0A7G2CAE7_9TRYP|nr:minichromosome maintenance protein 9 [Angomonas deanei]CAD2216529.1 MCM OB domain/MCM P-loop domain/MCM AAA-lid domain containing protein, putative [Angomonas deanei]|eukprot:EPY38681.1 minichromosome maintenance protein 9 [Angomonas deanei]
MSDLPPDVAECLKKFLVECCDPPYCPEEDIELGGRCHYTQQVDCMKLTQCSPLLGQYLLSKTLFLIAQIKTTCLALCKETGKVISEHDLSIRFTHLPSLGGTMPTVLPPEGQLVEVCGSIVRMTTKKVVPHSFRLMCPKCRALTEEYSNQFNRGENQKYKCSQASCKGEELSVVGQEWMDYVECRLQQRSNQSGRLPKSIRVTLDDELGSKCSVGQFVEVIGILHNKWKHVFPLSKPSIEPTIAAINILPMEAYRGAVQSLHNGPRRSMGRRADFSGVKFAPESFFLSMADKRERDVALSLSVCSHIAGLFAPRMSVLLSALGGSSTASKNGMHVRSTIHCLYVGDPSTGKTQLLRFAAAIAPRSTSTTGMGSTSAGLTVAASKEGGEWVLEPGALVLSDGGSCIIDELRTVSPADRASLHEAMEQQTISVAKGGIVAKLRTVCSVLSACNPPRKKRNGQTEIGVGGPLLSRFDFIFLLWDIPQAEMDQRIADHILSHNTTEPPTQSLLSQEDVAQYLWWVRSQYAHIDGPTLTDAAADLLAKYYEIQRQRGTSGALGDGIPITVRFLESLVRICQSHAKLHLQSSCTIEDAAMTVFLMERSAYSLKIPLFSIGEELYTSSRLLDTVFLSSEPSNIALQTDILSEIVKVVLNYGHYSGPSATTGDVDLREETPSILKNQRTVTNAMLQSIKNLSQRVNTPTITQVVYSLPHERDRGRVSVPRHAAPRRSLSTRANSSATPEYGEQVLLSTPSSSGGAPAVRESGPGENRRDTAPMQGDENPSRKRVRSAEEILQSLKRHF